MSVEVTALAAIGQDQHLLVVRRRGATRWSLPGVPVASDEPVEAALRRNLTETFGVAVTFLTFLALVEDGQSARSDTTRHVFTLIFDTGLAGRPVDGDTDLELCWLSSADLTAIELNPPGLSAGLLSGRFDDGDRWLPWRRHGGH